MDPCRVASSSPELPSLSEIFSENPKRPLLRSGSNATVLPSDALHTFTSAANLPRDAPEVDIDTGKIPMSPSRKPKTINGLAQRPAADAQVTTREEAPITIESSPREKAWQKFKSRTPTPERKQPQIPKGRVTKAITKDKPRRKPGRSRIETDTVSRHFAAKGGEAQPADEEKVTEDGEPSLPSNNIEQTKPQNMTSCSGPALQRRVDWTPPSAKNAILIASDSDHRELLSSVDKVVASKEVFQNLFCNYARKDDSASIPSGQQEQADFLKKRKRIELVSTTNEQDKRGKQDTHDMPVTEISPSKPAPTKKKTRTITELATAPYTIPEPEFDLSAQSTRDSLLNYFDSGGEVKALVEHQSIIMSKNKEAVKPKKPKAKPRKKKNAGEAENPILLSPNSALKQSSNQDFVFGTSSQLVQEESPTTLRELQIAIQASTRDDDPFGESDSQGLWHASARDNDGALMSVDVVDLVRTPALPEKHQNDPTPSNQEQFHVSDQAKSDDFIDIDDITFDMPQTQKAAPKQQNPHNVQTQKPPTPRPSKPQIPTTAQVPVGNTNIPCPTYGTYTDAQLSRQLASYGFKPVKKRQAMIALLEQCWASKNPGAVSVPSQPMSTTASLTSPKKRDTKAPAPTTGDAEKPVKRRGRPKKTEEAAVASTSKAATAPTKSKEGSPKRPRGRPKQPARKVEEIADSDSDPENEVLSPSPSPTSSAERIFSSPPPLDLDLSATEETDASLTLTPNTTDAQQATLFTLITRAVTTAPRSSSQEEPSWHERMLLYDPVVLEDLAAWLNAGQLARVGWDGPEVAPADVKRWCEARSVVCLWKVNLRGKERKRY
ncbi:hypothetical protein DL764_003390 [Monosporascus ibericus]|uniref:Structure-specific endonuclease subunit SLX4 n=1 Tax=Monosporascus ibericus TaxID=155417 RepID=A0A4Q4TK07_9PEZI|nr:hypothetical protein DL764_003390 [Monosporascus ibericus]